MALAEQLHALLRSNAVDLSGDDLGPLRRAASEHRVTIGINAGDSVVVAPGGKVFNKE